MANIRAIGTLRDKEGKLLLQLRDEPPQEGSWVLFGGSLEKDETPEAAFRREIREELGYEVQGVESLGVYNMSGTEMHAFLVREPVDPGRLRLGEGAGIAFVKPSGLKYLQIGFNQIRVLEDYIARLG